MKQSERSTLFNAVNAAVNAHENAASAAYEVATAKAVTVKAYATYVAAKAARESACRAYDIAIAAQVKAYNAVGAARINKP